MQKHVQSHAETCAVGHWQMHAVAGSHVQSHWQSTRSHGQLWRGLVAWYGLWHRHGQLWRGLVAWYGHSDEGCFAFTERLLG